MIAGPVGALVRWWRFVRLTRGREPVFGVPSTHSTQAARQQATWELVARTRGIRRRPPRPQPNRRARPTEGNSHG